MLAPWSTASIILSNCLQLAYFKRLVDYWQLGFTYPPGIGFARCTMAVVPYLLLFAVAFFVMGFGFGLCLKIMWSKSALVKD